MALFGWFKPKKQRNLPPDQVATEIGGLITQEKYKLKRERMQLEHEIEMLRLERQRQHLEESLGYMEEDGGIEGLFENLVMNALAKNHILPEAQHVNVPGTVVPGSTSPPGLTDLQFQEIWNRIPVTQRPLIKMARPDQIRGWIKNNYPTVDDSTIERAIVWVKQQ